MFAREIGCCSRGIRFGSLMAGLGRYAFESVSAARLAALQALATPALPKFTRGRDAEAGGRARSRRPNRGHAGALPYNRPALTTLLSSRGLGRSPLTALTPVRIRVGAPPFPKVAQVSRNAADAAFFVGGMFACPIEARSQKPSTTTRSHRPGPPADGASAGRAVGTTQVLAARLIRGMPLRVVRGRFGNCEFFPAWEQSMY